MYRALFETTRGLMRQFKGEITTILVFLDNHTGVLRILLNEQKED